MLGQSAMCSEQMIRDSSWMKTHGIANQRARIPMATPPLADANPVHPLYGHYIKDTWSVFN